MSDNSVRDSSTRLPTTVIPVHYCLHIDASQLDQYQFEGIVDIDVQVNRSRLAPLDLHCAFPLGQRSRK